MPPLTNYERERRKADYSRPRSRRIGYCPACCARTELPCRACAARAYLRNKKLKA